MTFQINSFSATDWRGVLKSNQRKTVLVIASFIAIYFILGLVIDLYIHGAFVAGNFSNVAFALITLKITPAVTFILLSVAALSLIITYTFHDKLMLLGTEYYEITPRTARNLQEQQLYNVVEELKIAAGMRYMPKVYLIEANYMNAFASGYSEKSAMLAITRGLMEKLSRSELQAVMAHELSHIRHADIKLTLTASVLSNLILIVIDFLFYGAIFSDNRKNNNGLLFIIILARYLLPIITILLLFFLSRTREYMADAGCVELTRDNQPLANALLKIEHDHKQNAESYAREYGQTRHEDVRRASYIYDPFSANIHPVKSLSSLFSTHPPIEKRLHALGFKVQNMLD